MSLGADCGHIESQCIIGNFWLCKRCDDSVAPTVGNMMIAVQETAPWAGEEVTPWGFSRETIEYLQDSEAYRYHRVYPYEHMQGSTMRVKRVLNGWSCWAWKDSPGILWTEIQRELRTRVEIGCLWFIE